MVVKEPFLSGFIDKPMPNENLIIFKLPKNMRSCQIPQQNHFPSDIEISRSTVLKPITEIAQKLGIDPNDIIPYGKIQ